jgi:glutathione S-transferase
MKLYASPFSSSFAVRLALAEADLPVDIVWVDLATKRTSDGSDLAALNPKALVPTLVLNDRAVLTEIGACLQYVGDQKPCRQLVPPPAAFERYRLQEWLSFLAGEIHKPLGLLLINGPSIDPTNVEGQRRLAHHLLPPRLDHIARALALGGFLMGDYFTVADCYLFATLIWARYVEFDLAPWPVLAGYFDRIAARPAVAAAFAAERAARVAARKP